MKKPTKWSKAWWTPEIMELRRIYTATTQHARRDGTGVKERDEARKKYRRYITEQGEDGVLGRFLGQREEKRCLDCPLVH